MNNENLRENLEELHLALLQMAPIEEPLQIKRDKLAEQIRETLDQADLGGFRLSLKESLEKELVSFEEKHPRVSQIMREITNMLSSSGI